MPHVRRDWSGLPEPATTLLHRYEGLVRAQAGSYPNHDQDEIRNVGRLAVLEAHLCFDATRGTTQMQWVRHVVHAAMQRFAEQSDRLVPRGRFEVYGDTADEVHELDELRQKLFEHMYVLTPRQQIIVQGRLQGDSFSEIGAAIGVSVQRTHIEYRNAIDRLRAELRLGQEC